MAVDKQQIDESLLASEAESIGDEFDTKFTFLDPGAFDQSLSKVLVQQDKLKAARNSDTAVRSSTFPAAYPPGRGVISLTRFAISNFQGIHYTSVEELNPAARWIFLTGENGFGKTSVLRAIAHALSGPLEVDALAAADPASIPGYHSAGVPQSSSDKTVLRRALLEMGYERDGQPGGIVKTVGSAEGKLTGYLGYQLVAYGPLRLSILDDATQNRPTKQQSNVFSLFNPIGSRLYNADYELNQAYLTSKQPGGSMDRFYRLLELIQTITAERISYITVSPQTNQVVYQENGDDGKMMAPATPYQYLATGYQSLINLVVDLYLRLAGPDEIPPPQELVGLVLIDELENHLHPHMQRELPLRLRMLFPLVQFIVSTHSPIPLLGAPKDAIFLRVDRDVVHGIIVQPLDVDISNLLPNAILSSPIFGFQELVPISHDGSEWIQTADYATGVRDQAIETQLAQFLTEERQQKLLALLHTQK